jgi:hypothetical protein
MIGEAGDIDRGSHGSLEEENKMLRTISAALLAVSVLAAPALAGSPGKPFKTTHQTPVIKALSGNAKVMNANASMGRHHRHHRYHHRHHRHHRH